MSDLPPWAWPVLAYLVGAIPVGVLLARSRGIDLRQVGSGNIGATNAVRAMGTRWGLVVFALDVCKAYVPVMLASRALGASLDPSFDASPWIAATGAATVVGHVFPIYLMFRGGKGVACALGVFAAVDPGLAAAGLVLYVQSLVLTRSSAVGSLTAVTAMTLAAFTAGRDLSFQILAVGVCLLIWVRHQSNVRELIAEAKARKLAKSAQA
jgi:glycerol-3-phosphate acyltransferase PlsY